MQDGVVRKASGGLLVKRPAGTRERLHLQGAVMLFKQRCRAACGVVAGLAFALQHQYLSAGLCQLPANGCTSHACTDHDHIPDCFAHIRFTPRDSL